jgi:hypothetical protein
LATDSNADFRLKKNFESFVSWRRGRSYLWESMMTMMLKPSSTIERRIGLCDGDYNDMRFRRHMV